MLFSVVSQYYGETNFVERFDSLKKSVNEKIQRFTAFLNPWSQPCEVVAKQSEPCNQLNSLKNKSFKQRPLSLAKKILLVSCLVYSQLTPESAKAGPGSLCVVPYAGEFSNRLIPEIENGASFSFINENSQDVVQEPARFPSYLSLLRDCFRETWWRPLSCITNPTSFSAPFGLKTFESVVIHLAAYRISDTQRDGFGDLAFGLELRSLFKNHPGVNLWAPDRLDREMLKKMGLDLSIVLTDAQFEKILQKKTKDTLIVLGPAGTAIRDFEKPLKEKYPDLNILSLQEYGIGGNKNKGNGVVSKTTGLSPDSLGVFMDPDLKEPSAIKMEYDHPLLQESMAGRPFYFSYQSLNQNLIPFLEKLLKIKTEPQEINICFPGKNLLNDVSLIYKNMQEFASKNNLNIKMITPSKCLEIRSLWNNGFHLKVILPGAVAKSDMKKLISESEKIKGCTGDQSLMEVLSAGGIPSYEVRPHKEGFFQEIVDLLEHYNLYEAKRAMLFGLRIGSLGWWNWCEKNGKCSSEKQVCLPFLEPDKDYLTMSNQEQTINQAKAEEEFREFSRLLNQNHRMTKASLQRVIPITTNNA
jgi:hypothetical protein